MTIPFTHIHSSSRFDKSLQSLRNAAKKYAKDAALITWTENTAPARKQEIRDALPGYGHSFPKSSGDCGISFRKERFELIHSEDYESTKVPYFNKRGNKLPPQRAQIAVLRDKKTGEIIVVVVMHLGAGIEGDFASKNSNRRTFNWLASFRGGIKRANELKKKYGAKGVVWVADFNISFKHAWARALVKSVAPLYRLTWRKPFPSGGTHAGGRLIDATLLKGRIKSPKGARLYEDDASSDHRPYAEVLVIGKKKKSKK